jgi:hypothetical protein
LEQGSCFGLAGNREEDRHNICAITAMKDTVPDLLKIAGIPPSDKAAAAWRSKAAK